MIIDVIVNDQGCNKTKVVRDLNEYELSSRMTTLKHLDELIKSGVITMTKSKGNSRDWKLSVDKFNPITIGP